eukprot:SAG11_NODE_708_length_7648_cov_3.486687_5_plen_136_part_00
MKTIDHSILETAFRVADLPHASEFDDVIVKKSAHPLKGLVVMLRLVRLRCRSLDLLVERVEYPARHLRRVGVAATAEPLELTFAGPQSLNRPAQTPVRALPCLRQLEHATINSVYAAQKARVRPQMTWYGNTIRP